MPRPRCRERGRVLDPVLSTPVNDRSALGLLLATREHAAPSGGGGRI
jgi:hypothetical protein